MSISQFHAMTSNFHQQPLLSTSGIENKGSVTTEEVIHQWDVNDFVISLIQEQDSLKYKTTDRDQKEICTRCIEISEEDNLEEMISYVKGSAVMVRDNGFVNFCSIYKTWEVTDAEDSTDIHLICGPEGLAWNTFKKSTNESCFLDFQKTTIPSSQCHPETIELIEKIKTETFDNMPLLYCLMTDFQVRVIDRKHLKISLEKYLDYKKFFLREVGESTFDKICIPFSVASGCLLRKMVVSTVCSAAGFLGGGVLGNLAGVFVGGIVGPAALIPGMVAAAISVDMIHGLPHHYDLVSKKQKALQEKMALLPQQPSLFVEIEPISLPSEIDPRMRVSKFTWAVTVVNGLKGPSKNHTAIIVEGLANEYFQGSVPDKEYFIHKSEFNPPIKSHLYSLRKLKEYIPQGMQRTEVWMRPARQQRLHKEQTKRGEN